MSDAPEPRPAHRPVILDDEKKREDLLKYIRIGLSRAKALRRVGVLDHHTLRAYCESNPVFADDLANAEIDCELWHINNLNECARDPGEVRDDRKKRSVMARGTRLKASLAFLARKFPEDWAQRTKHEVTGKNGGPIETDSTINVKTDLARCVREFDRFAKQLMGERAISADGNGESVPKEL